MIEEPVKTFIKYCDITTIYTFYPHLAHVQILGRNQCGATIKYTMEQCQLYGEIQVRKNHAEKYIESTSLQIKPLHWVGEPQLSMEGVVLDYFNNDKKI